MTPPHNFTELLKEKISDEIKTQVDLLALGTAADWGDYQKRAGIINGLRRLERIINDITEDKK